MKFLNYLFTSPDKRIWVWVVFIVSIIIGIGAISQGAIWAGIITIVVMNGAYAFGSWMNYTGRWV